MTQVCIHDVLRPQIFANAGFTARPDLWVLQTILLVECFGKSRAGQKQHDMSHLFHGLLINLIRRSDCQSIRPPTLEEATHDLEDDWRTWCEAEQKKRYVAKAISIVIVLIHCVDLRSCALYGTRSTPCSFASLFACRHLNFDQTCHVTNHCGRPARRRHGINYGRSNLQLRCSCHV